MYPYSPSVSPAAKSHLEAQLSFFNGISKSLFRSVQQFSELNLQFAQGLLEESRIAGQHLITVDRAEDLFQAAAASGQPVAEQLRIYQQQASRLAADAKLTWPAWQRNMWLKRAARPKYWPKKWRARLPKKRKKMCASSKTRFSVSLNRSRLSKTAAAVTSAARRLKRKAALAKACKAPPTRVASSLAVLN